MTWCLNVDTQSDWSERTLLIQFLYTRVIAFFVLPTGVIKTWQVTRLSVSGPRRRVIVFVKNMLLGTFVSLWSDVTSDEWRNPVSCSPNPYSNFLLRCDGILMLFTIYVIIHRVPVEMWLCPNTGGRGLGRSRINCISSYFHWREASQMLATK